MPAGILKPHPGPSPVFLDSNSLVVGKPGDEIFIAGFHEADIKLAAAIIVTPIAETVTEVIHCTIPRFS